jgi:hypothetical protein
MKDLNSILIKKADDELHSKICTLTDSIRLFPDSIGMDGYDGRPDRWTKLKTRDGKEAPPAGSVANSLEESLFEGFREAYREQFAAAFVAKVEAMQREMESYIGEITATEQPEP